MKILHLFKIHTYFFNLEHDLSSTKKSLHHSLLPNRLHGWRMERGDVSSPADGGAIIAPQRQPRAVGGVDALHAVAERRHAHERPRVALCRVWGCGQSREMAPGNKTRPSARRVSQRAPGSPLTAMAHETNVSRIREISEFTPSVQIGT